MWCALSTRHAIYLLKRERLWFFRLDNAMYLQDLVCSSGKVQLRYLTRSGEAVSLRNVRVITVPDSSKKGTDLSTPVNATAAHNGGLNEFEEQDH